MVIKSQQRRRASDSRGSSAKKEGDDLRAQRKIEATSCGSDGAKKRAAALSVEIDKNNLSREVAQGVTHVR